MSSWRNEVKQHVHSIVSETRVTLDAGFCCKDFVVFSLKVPNNLAKAAAVLDLFQLLGSASLTKLHCQSGHRSQVCRPLLAKREYPLHPVQVLQAASVLLILSDGASLVVCAYRL